MGQEVLTNACAAIVYSWTWGQRISDALILQRRWIMKVRLRGTLYWAVRQLRGKVVQCIGPFCLHVEITHPIGEWIASELTKTTRGPLFKTTPAMISRVLHAVMGAKRAIRRGGLQDLAMTGMALDDIRRIFSQHKSTEMLRGYLGYGALATQDAEVQRRTANRLEARRTL